MATAEFNAICFLRNQQGEIPRVVKYRKISNRAKFIRFITEKFPDVWYINWYDQMSKNYLERQYLQ